MLLVKDEEDTCVEAFFVPGLIVLMYCRMSPLPSEEERGYYIRYCAQGCVTAFYEEPRSILPFSGKSEKFKHPLHPLYYSHP